MLWEVDRVLLSESGVRILIREVGGLPGTCSRDPLLARTKLPSQFPNNEWEKGTVEALIREVIKGRVFFGAGECFTATAGFLTSLQMSSVDTSVSTPRLLWGELNCCAAS